MPKVVEGELQVLDATTQGTLLGKYFASIPPGRPGTKEGISFKLLMFETVPTSVKTAVERVVVVIDEKRTVPWASVELETGLFNTTIEISSAELGNVSCLKAPRLH